VTVNSLDRLYKAYEWTVCETHRRKWHAGSVFGSKPHMRWDGHHTEGEGEEGKREKKKMPRLHAGWLNWLAVSQHH
jgi:hypothetical protein